MAYIQQSMDETSKPDFNQYRGQDADDVMDKLRNLGKLWNDQITDYV